MAKVNLCYDFVAMLCAGAIERVGMFVLMLMVIGNSA